MAKPARKSVKPAEAPKRRRAVMLKMDEELRNELDVLASTRKQSIQQLGLEAIRDLLGKYERPVNLRDALRKSAGEARKPRGAASSAANAAAGKRGKPTRKKG